MIEKNTRKVTWKSKILRNKSKDRVGNFLAMHFSKGLKSLFQDNWINIMAANTLAPCVTFNSSHSTVEWRYNAVTFVKILHSALQWQWQYVSQTLDSQKTPKRYPQSCEDFGENWPHYKSTTLYFIKMIKDKGVLVFHKDGFQQSVPHSVEKI